MFVGLWSEVLTVLQRLSRTKSRLRVTRFFFDGLPRSDPGVYQDSFIERCTQDPDRGLDQLDLIAPNDEFSCKMQRLLSRPAASGVAPSM